MARSASRGSASACWARGGHSEKNILAHPFIVYAFVLAAALLAVRVVRKRPVPELIPERALGLGCAAGVALFLAGNFIAAHLIGR
jgi:hypothetical protein